MWELGSEPTSGSLMVRMSCLQNMVRHVCNICQKANEEQFRRAVHWCKHVTDGDGNTHSWVMSGLLMMSTQHLASTKVGRLLSHTLASISRVAKATSPSEPREKVPQLGSNWSNTTLDIASPHSIYKGALLHNAKVMESLCRSLFACYLLWRLVMRCHTYWWQTPPNLPAAQKNKSFRMASSNCEVHTVLCLKANGFACCPFCDLMMSSSHPWGGLWRYWNSRTASYTRCNIYQTDLLHSRKVSWNSRLAHGCEGFLNCAMSLVLRRPNDINCCVLGLHEKVWNKILKAFCNCTR